MAQERERIARAAAGPARRLPMGAEPQHDGGTHFRVWAPRARRVEVEARLPEPTRFALEAEGEGWFAGSAPVPAGARYGLCLDGGAPIADPASRFQPDGPEGLSEVVDPGAYRWRDADWRGPLALEGQVLYELHVGTFTRAGTWAAAALRLPALRALGVTAVEVMPVADFAGRFGWGYDGVSLYAPTRLYGRPDDFRRFVDRAHALGLGVVLDVVYNHLGPVGNVLPLFSDDWFSQRGTDWGDAIGYDGPARGPVRAFFAANAGYWIDEFHVDGLRFDSTQDVHDRADDHVLAEMARRARAAAGARRVLLFAENEPQDERLVRDPAAGGYGFDAIWNDDFHHGAFVALTGRREAYMRDFAGLARELVAATRRGFLYQGQRYPFHGRRRGTPTVAMRPAQCVHFLENHDQVAHSARGQRRREQGHPGDHRALLALLLLGPATPLLFQGQELDRPPPFLYFAEPGDAALHAAIAKGRAAFLSQFESIAQPAVLAALAPPADPATFEACRIAWDEGERRGPAWHLIHDLLALRRGDAAFRAQARERIDAAVLGERSFALRFFGDGPDGDRLLVVHLDAQRTLDPPSEPLLAPPSGRCWRVLWSSEDPRYGGAGLPSGETPEGWRLAAHGATVLAPASPE